MNSKKNYTSVIRFSFVPIDSIVLLAVVLGTLFLLNEY